MGKPAARLGDMTAHGGCIVAGFPTVLIGGMPAARATDMHVCPMVTVLVPHVGGPIAMGSAGVLIGGMPAARMGDMAVCVGPPDVIVLGCMTVLIGEVGSGSASGGGAGASAVAAAQASARTAMTDNTETSTQREHWVEFQFVDKAGLPVSGIPYAFKDPDSNESAAVLRLDGRIRRDALSAGNCKVKLFTLSNAKWSKKKANVGEKVKMTAELTGYEAGTKAIFQIYEQDVKGHDELITTIEAETQSDKVEAEWEYVYTEDTDDEMTDEETQKGYSAPEYYFEVTVGQSKARSDLLGYKDWIEIELKDEDDNPIANEEYILYLSNGEVRKGKLDGSGHKKEEKIPPGYCKIIFPNIRQDDGIPTREKEKSILTEPVQEPKQEKQKSLQNESKLLNRLQICDHSGKPVANLEYELELNGNRYIGKTDKNGWTDKFDSIGVNKGKIYLGEFNYEITFEDKALDDVLHTKSMLNALGFNAGSLNGNFERRTEDAIRAYQKERKLPLTGKADQTMLDKLKDDYQIS